MRFIAHRRLLQCSYVRDVSRLATWVNTNRRHLPRHIFVLDTQACRRACSEMYFEMYSGMYSEMYSFFRRQSWFIVERSCSAVLQFWSGSANPNLIPSHVHIYPLALPILCRVHIVSLR